MNRNNLLYFFGSGLLRLTVLLLLLSSCHHPREKPNVIFVFADQWRAEALGYAGNSQVKTPALDKFASEAVVFTNAVSTFPVCTPYRASLMTGQYPLTHQVIYNDKPLKSEASCIAEVYKEAGYHTAYIGKWHIDGNERDAFIPKERRQGFDYWKVLECTHDYNNSWYWDHDDQKRRWDGYDAIAQTNDAIEYLKQHDGDVPFILFLSWGPPHGPYHTAPEIYRELYADPGKIALLPNVPADMEEPAKETIAGYYAHIAALDDCFDALMNTVKEQGLDKNTIIVFTSDHGDMLYSHGKQKKQKPWDESVNVPLIIQAPGNQDHAGRIIEMPIGTPDLMPTLLGLSGIPVPESVEGDDYTPIIYGREEPGDAAKLIMCPVPFGQGKYANGGREYRGLKGVRYTYVEDLEGPWLLYDNKVDPYQMNNLVNDEKFQNIQGQLAKELWAELDKRGDQFLTGQEYMTAFDLKWYQLDSVK